MEILTGRVADYNENGELVIVCKYGNTERYIKQKLGGSRVRIGMTDGRKASVEQIKKAHALIGEIADYSGGSDMDVLIGLLTNKTSKEQKVIAEDMKKCLKLKFISSQVISLHNDIFSFSEVDVTTAKEFITFVIDFIVEWGIPTKRALAEQCEDIGRYIMSCLKYKQCAICGKPAELHHVTRVGMGNNREEIVHEGMQALPLCRGHHTEAHTVSSIDFMTKYHLESGILDKNLCKIWGLKAHEQVQEL